MSKFRVGTPLGGLVWGVLCALIAVMLLFWGFWRTLLVAAFFGVGYFFGAHEHRAEAVKHAINKWFPPKGE